MKPLDRNYELLGRQCLLLTNTWFVFVMATLPNSIMQKVQNEFLGIQQIWGPRLYVTPSLKEQTHQYIGALPIRLGCHHVFWCQSQTTLESSTTKKIFQRTLISCTIFLSQSYADLPITVITAEPQIFHFSFDCDDWKVMIGDMISTMKYFVMFVYPNSTMIIYLLPLSRPHIWWNCLKSDENICGPTYFVVLNSSLISLI
jgi:hypothetical protein